MPTSTYEALRSRIDPAEVARVCADLIRFNTANPPGNERMAAEYVADYLGPAFETHFVPDPDDDARASAICRLRGGRGAAGQAEAAAQAAGAALPGAARPAPALIFNGHLDVVPVGAQQWQRPPFRGEIAEGKVWGRGAADMKSGVAAMLVAARVLTDACQELAGDLIVAATAGEELGMTGAYQLTQWPDLGPVAAVIISEPTDNTVGLAERGVLWIELATHGKTAHGSTPQLGRNAINMMRKLLDGLDRAEIPFTPHPVLGGCTYSIDVVHGGNASNVVPDHCVASVDMRTVPGQEHAGILRQIEQICAELAAREPGFAATVQAAFDLPAVDTPADQPAVRRFAAAVAAATGRPARHAVVRFATEAAVFVPVWHVPAIIYGPGDPALAHQPDEYAAIDKMAEAAQVYLAAALTMLNPAE